MYVLELDENKKRALESLLHVATKAGGLEVAEAAITLVKSIKPVEAKPEKKKGNKK
jgi:hypothetical protein